MTQEQLIHEYSALPDEAQRQVADFITFLRERYTTGQVVRKSCAADLANDPFIGMWRDRQNLEESTAWVRSMRKTEWGNGS